GQHVAEFVEERARVIFGGEVAALPAPVRPGAGKTIKDLPRVRFAAITLVLGQFGQRGLVRHGPPQPGCNLGFLDALQAPRHTGLAEIFLRQNVGRYLAPVLRHHEAFKTEDDRTVWVLDLTVCSTEWDGLVR